MSKYNNISALMKAICDAIREKDGSTELIKHEDIPERIRAILLKSQSDIDKAVSNAIATTRVDGTLVDAKHLDKGETAYGKDGKLIVGSRSQDGTYTFTKDYSGGVIDLGENNTYRYVNGENLVALGREALSKDLNLEELLATGDWGYRFTNDWIFRAFFDYVSHHYTEKITSLIECFSSLTYTKQEIDFEFLHHLDNTDIPMNEMCKNCTTPLKNVNYIWPYCTSAVAIFQNNENINVLDLTNITKEKDVSFGVAFAGSSLTEIKLSPKLAMLQLVGTFYNCRKLTSLDLSIPKKSQTSLKQLCEGCSSLKTIKVGSNITPEDFIQTFASCTSLTELDLSKIPICKVDMTKMCSGDSSLKSVILNSNITPTNMKSAFQNCSSLSSINIDVLPVSTIDMSHAFDGCSSLTSFPKINLSPTSLSYAFANTGLLSFDFHVFPLLPSGTYSFSYYENMFENCTNLKKVVLSSAAVISSNTFKGCHVQVVFSNAKYKNLSTTASGIYSIIELDLSYMKRGNESFYSAPSFSMPDLEEIEFVKNGLICDKDMVDNSIGGVWCQFDISKCPKFTCDGFVKMVNSLANVKTGTYAMPSGSHRNIVISSALNSKLTTQQKALATNKGYTIKIS